MKVRVKYDRILDGCDEYVEFIIRNKRVIIMKADFEFAEHKSILIDHKLAKSKRLIWKLMYRIPKPIEPQYNQEAISELRI